MRDTWEIRFEWIQTILQWVSLIVGVGLSILQLGLEPATVAASIGVTAYTVAMQWIPMRNKETPLVGGLLALLGVATALFAISLTGGLESAFLLYLAVPVFFAAAFHGTVLGVLTTFAAIIGLVAVDATSSEDSLRTTLPLMVVFYALVGITFSQARRIFIDEPEERTATTQYRRVQSAHLLLADLASLAGSAELNPIAIGRAALRDLAVIVPYAAGSVAINDGSEQIIVATRGQPGRGDEAVIYPIALDGNDLGTLRLWPLSEGSLSPHQVSIDRSMRSVALAFANVLLLQTIAHRAVREERIRLGRELHDEIGPSLVSIGLGLDLAMGHVDRDGDLRDQLESLRESVGYLVEEVRTTVTRLRSTETPSLREWADSLAADAPAEGPSFLIEIDETEAPREPEATELAAIMAEAVRNAVEHAGATTIRIEGFVRRDRGSFSVIDDGRGFDLEMRSHQRYGLIGMQERAETIAARFSVDSQKRQGTRVTVDWGPQ